MKPFRSIPMMLAVGAAAAAATPAAAQQQVGGGFSISGSVTATTDYRFRGISQSNEDAALQSNLTLEHDSGFYVGAFGSTLGDNPRYGDSEVDFYAGYTREIAAATNLDAGLIYYLYPDGDDRFGESDYFEPYASVSHILGPVTAQVGAAYAPEQDGTGGEDNLYLYGNLRGSVPFTPVTAVAHLGRNSGSAVLGGDYFDWRLGLELATGPATFSLDYVDTDLPSGPDVDAALLLSVRLGF